jgi:di/tricarboxylate transporter
MSDIIIIGIVFFSIYKTIELFVLQRERKLMIEKMGEIPTEMLQSNISSLQSAQKSKFQNNHFLMLRLGVVAIAVGIGWILGNILNEIQMGLSNNHWGWDSTLIATVSLCVGIALIIVYFIERHAAKEVKKEG